VSQASAKVQKYPNLFEFATSELSQDAFICWLASWASVEYENSPHKTLHIVAKHFVHSLIRKKYPEYDEKRIINVTPRKQVKNTDVILEVNNSAGVEMVILIEDKTTSHFHENQKNYISNIKNMDEYKNSEIVPIFFKTFDQSNYTKEEENGFATYTRADFLKIFEFAKQHNLHNHIFSDYFDRLQEIENEFNSYKYTEFSNDKSKLKNSYWLGLFKHLKDHYLKTGDWGIVNNINGGFVGYFFNSEGISFKKDDNVYGLYVQLEYDLLTVKCHFHNKENSKRDKDAIAAELLTHFKKLDEGKNELTFDGFKPRAGEYSTLLRTNYMKDITGILDENDFTTIKNRIESTINHLKNFK
jgi:hypothetical protein